MAQHLYRTKPVKTEYTIALKHRDCYITQSCDAQGRPTSDHTEEIDKEAFEQRFERVERAPRKPKNNTTPNT